MCLGLTSVFYQQKVSLKNHQNNLLEEKKHAGTFLSFMAVKEVKLAKNEDFDLEIKNAFRVRKSV